MNFKRPRKKNDRHLEYVRSLPCVCCGNNIETEAAHIRFSCIQVGKRYVGKQEKPDDCWVVPLCGLHHREQHSMGEHSFWTLKRIDPLRVAAFLFALSGDFEAGENIIRHRGKYGHEIAA